MAPGRFTVVDPVLAAHSLHLADECVKLGEVIIAKRPRLGKHVPSPLHSLEHREFVEGESALGGVEHVEHDHFVAAMAESERGSGPWA